MTDPATHSISATTATQDDQSEFVNAADNSNSSGTALSTDDIQESQIADAEETPQSSYSSPKPVQEHSSSSSRTKDDMDEDDPEVQPIKFIPITSDQEIAPTSTAPTTCIPSTHFHVTENLSLTSPDCQPTSTDNLSLPILTATPVRRPRHKPGERRELLIRAVEDVLNLKISMRRAAQKYNLAKSSLCDFVRKNNIPLPNLRFKSCSNGSDTNSISSTQNLLTGLKRSSTDISNHSGTHSVPPHKIPCGVSRKVVNTRPMDTHILPHSFTDCYDNTQASLCRNVYMSEAANTISSDSISTKDASGDVLSANHMDHHCSSSNRTSVSVGGTTSFFPFPKPNRLESPWYNSAGLPTQVPLRTWNIPHNSQLSSTFLGTGCERKLPFNSTNQIRPPLGLAPSFTSDSGIHAVSGAMDLSDFKNSHIDANSLSQLIGSAIDTKIQQASTAIVVQSSESSIQDGQSISQDECGADRTSDQSNNNSEAASSMDTLEHHNDDRTVGCEPNTTTPSSSCPTPDHVTPRSNSANLTTTASSINESFSGIYSHPVCYSSSAPDGLPASTLPPRSNLSSTSNVTLDHFATQQFSAPISSTPSSILSDYSSMNQAALAAMLIQNARSFPGNTGGLPQVLSYLNLSYPVNHPSSQPTIRPTIESGFDLPQPPCSSVTDGAFRLNNPTPGQYPLSVQLASLIKQLSSQGLSDNSHPVELSQQSAGLNDLYQLLNKQLLSRLPANLNHVPANLASLLATQLFPSYSTTQLPNTTSLRTLLTTLPNSQGSTSLSGSNFATNSSLPLHSQQPTLASEQNTHRNESIIDLGHSMNMPKLSTSHAHDLIKFINNSPSPFHAVQTAAEQLIFNNFRELNEGEPWDLKPLDRFFVRKNGSTLIAATIGGQFKPGNGFYLLGAHTDSPCLRLKPVSERLKEGYVQLGVQTYGGGLWYTWFDRELKAAGRVVVPTPDGRLKEHLVHINKPIACVPSLAIHMNREVNTQGFSVNLEQHLSPILCTAVVDQLANVTDSVQPGEVRRHPSSLTRLICNELNIPHDTDNLELEIYFSDFQEARLGGLHDEFVHAPRLDNLFNSYTGLCGMIDSLGSLADESGVRVLCLYDHEEVGSESTQGADSAFTINLLRRIAASLAAKCEAVSYSHFEESLSKSFILSADQAHAVHPNYADKHENNHKPHMRGGVVLKTNVNQRYATNGATGALVRQLGRLSDIPVQEFVVRQDTSCGTTIGPLLASQTGVPTVDVGFTQLAMHSCRELCSAISVDQAIRFYQTFYDNVAKIWPTTV